MTSKNKKNICILLLIFIAITSYFLWLSNRAVEIIAVHQDYNFSSVLVKNFPLTDKGKINWWLENRDMLEAKFNIPKHAPDGSFTIIFWDFGDGYKEEGKYDRLCFNDMKTDKNCIEKEKYMTIYKFNNEEPFFSFNGSRYLLGESNKIIKMKQDDKS
ncbi:DUF943 family protein [Serratia sp. UGAL515B_01]|uniref:DUF943 family protein n=1 Tax=Serratia sp. UGAL515B_01 TaxID=2986763 RepID=UPI002954569B|nr:DUF943 family protein [Serratia sp. UGAL515B_01]WON77651.1 DUF943 family protein [Serratia sp. UGAL515B_01]